MAEPSAGDGPSYIALLRWFWTFAGLDGIPIGGSALNDGRHYLRAMSLLAPRADLHAIPGYTAACESGDDTVNFALLERVLEVSGVHVREGLVQDLQARRFHAVHEFLRLLHHRSTAATRSNTASYEAEPALAQDATEDDSLDSCFARGVMWLLRLVAEWPGAPTDADAAGLHASAKNLHAQLVGRTLTPASVDGGAVGARICSGELYALSCALIFSVPLVELRRPSAAETHARVLEFLAQEGYHVLDADGDPQLAVQQLASGCGSKSVHLITHPTVSRYRDFLVGAGGDDARWVHMSVLWRTMEAYTHSVLDLRCDLSETNGECKSVLRAHRVFFCWCSAVMAHSMALLSPDSSEEAAGFGEAGEALQSWMAAVCTKFDRALASVQHKHGKAAHEIQRAMPDVTDLVGAFSDGVCIPGLWSFYLPKLLPFSCLKIKEPLHASHRSGNWQLVQSLAPEALGSLVSFDGSGRMKLDVELDRPWVVRDLPACRTLLPPVAHMGMVCVLRWLWCPPGSPNGLARAPFALRRAHASLTNCLPQAFHRRRRGTQNADLGRHSLYSPLSLLARRRDCRRLGSQGRTGHGKPILQRVATAEKTLRRRRRSKTMSYRRPVYR